MNKEKLEKRKQTIEQIFSESSLIHKDFKYLSSKGIISKEVDGLGFHLGFGSTKTNILEKHNTIIINAGVENPSFAEWREKELGKYPSGLIASAKIKNIFTEGPPYYTFDIGIDENTRKTVVKEVIEIVEKDVFELFEMCKDINKITECFELPCFTEQTVIEYLCFLDKTESIEILIAALENKFPELRSQINYYISLIKENQLDQAKKKETYSDNSKRKAMNIAETFIGVNYGF